MNYNFNWTVIEKNIVPMLEGLGFGLLMAIIAITVGTIIGLLLAFAAVSKSKIARKLVQIFVTIFRNTPILILVYITYFGMPTIGINIPQGPLFSSSRWLCIPPPTWRKCSAPDWKRSRRGSSRPVRPSV